MEKLIGWCKRWLIPGSILFLVAFIPLYPKLPILNIDQTWTYIRLEDFLVAVMTGVLAVVLWREKRLVRSPLTIPFLLYLTVGLVSLVNILVTWEPELDVLSMTERLLALLQ